MKEIARITLLEQTMTLFDSLEGLLIGTGILSNPVRVVRTDDLETGDVVFYRLDQEEVIRVG